MEEQRKNFFSQHKTYVITYIVFFILQLYALLSQGGKIDTTEATPLVSLIFALGIGPLLFAIPVGWLISWFSTKKDTSSETVPHPPETAEVTKESHLTESAAGMFVYILGIATLGAFLGIPFGLTLSVISDVPGLNYWQLTPWNIFFIVSPFVIMAPLFYMSRRLYKQSKFRASTIVSLIPLFFLVAFMLVLIVDYIVTFSSIHS